MIEELIKKNRSYRRFHQEKRVSNKELVDLVELTRYIPSGRNLQPLKYVLLTEEKHNKHVFETLVWAGHLPGWHGAEEGERPAAYILICEDAMICTEASFDVGIAAQTILLAATEKGIGGCILLSFNKLDISYLLHLEEYIKPVMVIALGYPKEEVVIEDLEKDGSIKYWHDEKSVLHVPKRMLEDIVIQPFYL